MKLNHPWTRPDPTLGVRDSWTQVSPIQRCFKVRTMLVCLAACHREAESRQRARCPQAHPLVVSAASLCLRSEAGDLGTCSQQCELWRRSHTLKAAYSKCSVNVTAICVVAWKSDRDWLKQKSSLRGGKGFRELEKWPGKHRDLNTDPPRG